MRACTNSGRVSAGASRAGGVGVACPSAVTMGGNRAAKDARCRNRSCARPRSFDLLAAGNESNIASHASPMRSLILFRSSSVSCCAGGSGASSSETPTAAAAPAAPASKSAPTMASSPLDRRRRDRRRGGGSSSSCAAGAGGAAAACCATAGAPGGGLNSGGMGRPASSPVAAPSSLSVSTLSCLFTAYLSLVYVIECVEFASGRSSADFVTAPHASSSSVTTVSVPILVM